VLGLIQAFCLNWMYFEVDSFNLHTHAIRRHVASALIWLTAHLPFIMGFALSGSALSKVVLAHDTKNADPHDLWEIYEGRSEEHISDGLRWFYCGGLAIAIACMSEFPCFSPSRAYINSKLQTLSLLPMFTRFARASVLRSHTVSPCALPLPSLSSFCLLHTTLHRCI